MRYKYGCVFNLKFQPERTSSFFFVILKISPSIFNTKFFLKVPSLLNQNTCEKYNGTKEVKK